MLTAAAALAKTLHEDTRPTRGCTGRMDFEESWLALLDAAIALLVRFINIFVNPSQIQLDSQMSKRDVLRKAFHCPHVKSMGILSCTLSHYLLSALSGCSRKNRRAPASVLTPFLFDIRVTTMGSCFGCFQSSSSPQDPEILSHASARPSCLSADSCTSSLFESRVLDRTSHHSHASTAFFSACDEEERPERAAGMRPPIVTVELETRSVVDLECPATSSTRTSPLPGGASDLRLKMVHRVVSLLREHRACRACGVRRKLQGCHLLLSCTSSCALNGVAPSPRAHNLFHLHVRF